MKENKLGTYLSSFTEKDWSAYQKFAKSQYTDKSDYQVVINYIKKHKSRYDPSYMDSEYLRQKIKPKASKAGFANVINTICKSMEKYFIWAEIENDTMMEDTLLLQALGKRGLTNQFYKHKEKSKERRETLPVGLWNDYHSFMAEYLFYYCNMTSDISISKVALEDAHAKATLFYQTISGYLNVEMHNRTVLLKESWEDKLCIHVSPTKNLSHSLPFTVFDKLISLKYTKKESFYFELKKILKSETLSTDLSYAVTIHLSSFLNNQTVSGNRKLIPDLLELYQYGIEKNILFPNGNIPVIRFLNILLIACGIKEYDWAESFILNFSKLTGNELKTQVESLGKAHLEFSKNEFSNVFILLRSSKFKNFELEIRAKWLILASHYELNKDNFEMVEHSVNSFIYYIKRNKHKSITLSVDSFTKSARVLMLILKSNSPNEVLEKIKKESQLLYRGWLLKKINEKIDNKLIS